MFIIVLNYTLRTVIDDRECLILNRRRSIRHPACHLSDLDYADDISSLEDTIQEAERLLHEVESASKSFGLFLNPSKTNSCMSTCLVMIVYTRQMGVKLRE